MNPRAAMGTAPSWELGAASQVAAVADVGARLSAAAKASDAAPPKRMMMRVFMTIPFGVWMVRKTDGSVIRWQRVSRRDCVIRLTAGRRCLVARRGEVLVSPVSAGGEITDLARMGCQVPAAPAIWSGGGAWTLTSSPKVE